MHLAQRPSHVATLPTVAEAGLWMAWPVAISAEIYIDSAQTRLMTVARQGGDGCQCLAVGAACEHGPRHLFFSSWSLFPVLITIYSSFSCLWVASSINYALILV
jgi:hypothetical protein